MRRTVNGRSAGADVNERIQRHGSNRGRHLHGPDESMVAADTWHLNGFVTSRRGAGTCQKRTAYLLAGKWCTFWRSGAARCVAPYRPALCQRKHLLAPSGSVSEDTSLNTVQLCAIGHVYWHRPALCHRTRVYWQFAPSSSLACVNGHLLELSGSVPQDASIGTVRLCGMVHVYWQLAPSSPVP